MADRIEAILRALGLALLLLALPLPLSPAPIAGPHEAGLTMSADLEPCSGQDGLVASDPCCLVCPPVLFAFVERDSEPSYLGSATSLPEPERAQGIDPEPLRRPPRG